MNQNYKALAQCLETMRVIERRYLNSDTSIFDELFDGLIDRRGIDEEYLIKDFKEDLDYFNFFLDDYLDVISSFISFRRTMFTITLAIENHPQLEGTFARFIIARNYGVIIDSNDEYIEFRDKLNDKELEEFYAILTSRGIKIDGHTLVGVDFD